MSWVTNRTGVPARRRCASKRVVMIRWYDRSSEGGGSSAGGAGSGTRACATRRRCCSRPRAARPAHRRTLPLRPSVGARSIRARSSGERRPTPRRSPSRPSRTRSRPRSGRSRSKTRLRDASELRAALARRGPDGDAARRRLRHPRAGCGAVTSCRYRSDRAPRVAFLLRLEVEDQFQEHAVAEVERELHARRATGARAAPSPRPVELPQACASCHCWNVGCGGSVRSRRSAGIPTLTAALRMRDRDRRTTWLL